jgi:glutaredoxin
MESIYWTSLLYPISGAHHDVRLANTRKAQAGQAEMMQRGVARALLAKGVSRSRSAPLAAASVLARSSSVLARSAAPFSPLTASPLLHKVAMCSVRSTGLLSMADDLPRWRPVQSKLAGLVAAAGSTTAACAFCSSSAAVAPAAATTQPAEQQAADKGLPTVVLYQYEPCPYCCKVKAVLDYLRIPYEVVEVNPLTKKETKAFTDYRKVPVCKINGFVRHHLAPARARRGRTDRQRQRRRGQPRGRGQVAPVG